MKQILLTIGAILLSFTLRAQSVTYTCRYWFDQNHAQAITASFSDSTWQADIDVGSLSEGLHNMRLQMADTANNWNPPQTYLFFKLADTLQEDLVCHYWFDQNHEQIQHNLLGNGHLLLDVADLEDGMHTINILLEGEKLTTTQNYTFVKVTVENPTDEYRYHCWFDDDLNTMQTGWLGSGCFQLDVDGLPKGFHTVTVQLDDNGTLSAPQVYMFYRQPLGGCGISRWEYWLNDNGIIHSTDIEPTMDTLDILSLLPVETWPIRSSCFLFHPNGEEPYLYARNKISFRFWNTDDRFIEQSTFYIDENVSEPIVADTLERNTTVSIAAPRNNSIKWYKLPLQFGDSVAFMTDKACTLQLFAPSGEEVYLATAGEAMVYGGCYAWEDGTYYLAVHDVTGSGDELSLTNVYIHRYAILAYDVHLVGNGGCSTITFQGNGFNSLLDVYLVNAQNDTIRQLDIGHESNTTSTVTFNFYQENLGVYDAVFEFYEETIWINGALEVQEPVDIYLTSTVSHPVSFMSGTTVTYTFTITNNGNMSAYVVPLYLYIASPTPESITHLEIEGLNLPTLADYMNLDSLSTEDVDIIREWAKAKGDDHYFNFFSSVENNIGDNVAVRTNYFFINLAPFESKIIKLKITATTGAHQPIETWMTVPNEMIQPFTLIPSRNARGFCCVMNHLECYASIMSNEANSLALVVDGLALYFEGFLPAAYYVTIASCIVSSLNASLMFLESVFCNEEQGLLNKVLWAFSKSGWSIAGTALSCFPSFKEMTRAANIPDLDIRQIKYLLSGVLDNIINASALGSGMIDDQSCAFNNCFSGNKIGGKTDGRTPGDPNNIYGYLSESGSHYMRQEIQNIHYEIEFENDTTLATAAAHTIIVRDTLDASKFDLNSLAARSVTIGDKRLDLNGEQTFARTLDMRPELNVIAQVNQDYDPTTGIAEWTIQSLDPMTMEPTDDPNQGVLPVNYSGDGVGFIDYSVNLLQAFDDGTEISNRVGIIFDQEDLIMTPTWTNIVDAVKPTSHIENVTVEADTLNFNFVSSDNCSGVWYHTLYYRNDSTEMEWQVKKAQIFENSYQLRFNEYQTTEYLVMAIDSAGNVEEKEMVAEYIYYYGGPATQINPLLQGWNWWSTYINVDGYNSLAMLEEALGTNAMQIKSQSDFAQYLDIPGYGGYWYGTLDTILSNKKTYLIQNSTSCQIELTGMPVSPADHPITILPGWNWIGFPSSTAISFAEAFAGFTPTDGDQVKSQSGFSQYMFVPGYGGVWYGGLETENLTPGIGLMYKSMNTENATLVYPNAGRSIENVAYVEKHWTNDVHAYSGNMTLMAVVELDDVELASDNYELAAFANGECRGSAKLTYVEPLNRYFAFLTIAGDEAADLTFGLYNHTTGEENFESSDVIVYTTDASVGSLNTPMVVRFRGTTGSDEWANNLKVYPNPVTRGQRFSIGLDDVTSQPVRVEIVNVLGVTVSVETSTKMPASVVAPNTAGIYMLKITVEGKGVCKRKLVVK